MGTVAAVINRTIQTASVPGSGGVIALDFPIPTNRACRIRAVVGLSASSPFIAASFSSEYVVKNAAGTVTAPAANSGSTNPSNSGTLVASDVQCADANLTSGTATSTNWTISTTNARLTVTNQGSVTADVTAFFEVLEWGST